MTRILELNQLIFFKVKNQSLGVDSDLDDGNTDYIMHCHNFVLITTGQAGENQALRDSMAAVHIQQHIKPQQLKGQSHLPSKLPLIGPHLRI